MWRNPKYAGQVAVPEPQRQAPAEADRRLATFPRDRRGSGQEEELRLEVSEFNGSKFVSLRLWFKADDGRYLPSKKGVTLRKVELAEAIEALRSADRIIGDAPPPQRRGRQPQHQHRRAAGASSNAVSFDEFDAS